jgi:prepilin-type N-terminal cleavage/methylation domain
VHHPCSKRFADGFTLVELLTSILIIGVLAGIVLSVVGHVRAAAQATRCLSNLRQLQMANINHAVANRGRYVPVFSNSANTPVNRTPWHNNRGFVSMLAVGSSQTATVPSSLLCPIRGTYSGSNGYGYNFTGLSGGINEPGFVRGVKQSDIPRPSQTLAFADSLDWQIHLSASDDYAGEEKPTTQATAYRHKDSACIAYWDGHVAKLPRARIEKQGSLWRMLE